MPVGLAGAAGDAGVAIPGLLLGGGNAYGSWTPTPEPLTDVAAATAATTCRAALAVPDRGERVAVAERRGGWTYVLLAGPETEADPRPRPHRRDHGQQGSTDEGWFIGVEGYVGSDVTGVTVHTSSGLDVEASVAGNRFAAWWPSSEQSSVHPAETWSHTVHLADGSTRRTAG